MTGVTQDIADRRDKFDTPQSDEVTFVGALHARDDGEQSPSPSLPRLTWTVRSYPAGKALFTGTYEEAGRWRDKNDLSAGLYCDEEVVKTKRVAGVTAASICETAARLVGGPRAVTHGDKSTNFQNTADLWNALIQARIRRAGFSLDEVIFTPLTALDVANMLELFKVARRYSGTYNPDDYVDGAGYAGCAGEIAAKESV